MPIPKPRKYEKKNKYISRCIKNKIMQKEFKRKQRIAVCYSEWRRK